MKSEIKTAPSKKKDTYPCLKIWKEQTDSNDGAIVVVLFDCNLAGTVVYSTSTDEDNAVGYFSETWDEEDFKPFTGTITLTGE